MRRIAPIAALIGGLLLVWDRPNSDTLPEPPEDVVAAAFHRYEQLWREAAATAAEKLESGQLTTDRATRDWLSARGQLARRDAFATIAAQEQAELRDWTPEAHAAILRSYDQ